ncbi:30S ribosomal protein S20 [bacterium]|nr:MAG: 30S ribosomal protein S20 [bacterium]
MANHKSAIKKIKQDEKRRVRNKAVRTRFRNLVKAVKTALDSGDAARATEALAIAAPYLQKVAAKGIIHKNKAARHISRLTRQASAI